MARYKIIIIFILIASAFGVGIYYDFNRGLHDFQKTDIGSLVSEVGKEFFTPPPLNIGGSDNKIILLKIKVIAETNSQRVQNGLYALTENSKLGQAASVKANDMFKSQYFEHISPSGLNPGQLVQDHGYNYIIAGENLILGNFDSEKEMVQSWMESPGHRANILNTRYAEIGVAVIKGTYNGQTVWIAVQEFGLPLSSCAEPSLSLKDEVNSSTMQIDALSLQIDAKRSEIDNINPRTPYYKKLIDDYNQLVEDYNFLAEITKNLVLKYNSQVNDFNQCVAGE